VGSL
jgi:hypothetical protein